MSDWKFDMDEYNRQLGRESRERRVKSLNDRKDSVRLLESTLKDHGMKPLPRPEHKYCEKETLNKIWLQRKLIGKAGFMITQRMDIHRIGPPQLRDLQQKTICDECERPVKEIYIEHYRSNRWYKFYIRCHGQTETHELTESECCWAIENGARSRAFIVPEKQAARDWMDQQLTPAPYLLLEDAYHAMWCLCEDRHQETLILVHRDEFWPIIELEEQENVNFAL